MRYYLDSSSKFLLTYLWCGRLAVHYRFHYSLFHLLFVFFCRFSLTFYIYIIYQKLVFLKFRHLLKFRPLHHGHKKALPGGGEGTDSFTSLFRYMFFTQLNAQIVNDSSRLISNYIPEVTYRVFSKKRCYYFPKYATGKQNCD